ncbi:MAG: NAD(+) synthase [Gemmatimonadota bacterium]|jgi:NAD+ synthase|nr:NAD(+) synthase [Gemmatimonadota bacterium]
MTYNHTSTAPSLVIDPATAVDRIIESLRSNLLNEFRRKGYVVGMSSGVDSSVTAALAVRAVGPSHVFGVFMPERESDPDSLRIARELAAQLGIESTTEDIADTLEGAGCYQRRNDAIRRVVPEFRDDWGCKLVLPSDRLSADRLNVTYLVVREPGGEDRRVRLPAAEYRQIVAASNFKQRVRKMMEYYHADRLHFAVLGTPNRLEYDQGFFVKGGDGLADIKPIAHLYKSQVYQIADYLGVPSSVTSRPPTTDTFSLPQSQEEFYYNLPTRILDVVLHGLNTGRSAADVALEAGLTPEQVERSFRDIEQKRMTTRYLHLGPRLVEPVDLCTMIQVDL